MNKTFAVSMTILWCIVFYNVMQGWTGILLGLCFGMAFGLFDREEGEKDDG